MGQLDSAGNALWTYQFGTSRVDSALDVQQFGGQAVYVSGTTTGDLAGSISSVPGDQDAFVMKLDSTGTPIWTRQFGSTDTDFVYDGAVDLDGNYFVAGYTSGDIAGTPSGDDSFLAKYSPTGDLDWVVQTDFSDTDWGRAVDTDSNGNSYLAGFVNGHAYVNKYNSAGELGWQYVSDQEPLRLEANAFTGLDVVADSAGNVYLTGTSDGIESPVNYPKGTFLIKLDELGQPVWSRSLVTEEYPFSPLPNEAQGWSLDLDEHGNTLLTGQTTGNVASDVDTVGDVYLLRFSPNGDLLVAEQYGDFDYQLGLRVAADGQGGVYLAGLADSSFLGQSAFGASGFVMHLNGQVPEPSTNLLCFVCVVAGLGFGWSRRR
ncbi:SBBP repeat-containing protein [Aeoliella mucimassa]|uniref:Beta-propeller repeat protein n=1 Tax=Aeoliella mucimassa TaxID=2527972 RepID=A0A518AKJ8_9BACT|nr:SBBP repeat-containing protein [Aeoliella mucimassa]QDU55226.1 Beta-propeller repeat protein [Aeoliella mucimassa]